MCGIAGFLNFKNKGELAIAANSLQKHRGPDYQGTWNDDFIALAHQRLSIIDLNERSNQPFHKYNLVIVFNGEIYNYQELKTEHLSSRQFETTSDTEVVLEMFHKYGEKCLSYFLGMFAFAIYNKESGNLFLARDHYGIKPLFFTQTPSGFAFASELKTLLTIPDFNRNINMKSLLGSLKYLWVPGNESMFEGTYKLPPGHYLNIGKDLNYSIHCFHETKEKLMIRPKNGHIQKIKHALEASIDRHLVSDVPVGAFLSGGLDSSLISVMASKRNPRISTFTIASQNKDKLVEKMASDEKYAKMLADRFPFDHHEILISADIVSHLPEIVHYLDEPIGDPAAINTFLICKKARDMGIKVLLSGMGADEVFFGYRRMKATLLAQKLKSLPKFMLHSIKGLVSLLPVKLMGRGLRFSRWGKKFLALSQLPIQEAFRNSYSYFSPDELNALTDYQYEEKIKEIIQDHEQLYLSKFNGDPVNQMCHTDIQMFMVGLNLTYSDRASMAASIEVRVPFIDKEVINAAMSIPGENKFTKNTTKFILRKVAEDYLPKEIIYRPKSNFGAPIRSWVSNELKPMVDDLLSEENVKKRGILNPIIVRRIIEEDRKGLKDHAHRIYQLLTLELWFRNFVDNTDPTLTN